MDLFVDLVALVSLTGVVITVITPASLGAGMVALFLLGMVERAREAWVPAPQLTVRPAM